MDDVHSRHVTSAITLATRDLDRALTFYRRLGFKLRPGYPKPDFASLDAGSIKLNLIVARADAPWPWWGRVIFHTPDLDAFYAQIVAAGLEPAAPPQDAPWGERYFHITDPDGHELSFAWPL